MYIFTLNCVTEASYIPKVSMPAIKEVVGFDGFAGVDVKLDDGSEDKLLMLHGSVNPGVSTFHPNWKTTTTTGPKATLPEIAMMYAASFESLMTGSRMKLKSRAEQLTTSNSRGDIKQIKTNIGANICVDCLQKYAFSHPIFEVTKVSKF